NLAGRSRNRDGGGGRVRDDGSGRAPHQAISRPIRSDLSFGADAFPRICHSRRLSARLELPGSLERAIVQTPTSEKAPPDTLGTQCVTHLTFTFATDGREPLLLVVGSLGGR